MVIWSDGFESGNLSAWDQRGNGNWSPSISAAYIGNWGVDIFGPTSMAGDNGDYLTVLIPTSGYRNIALSYWWKAQSGLEVEDFVSGKYTNDGANWCSPLEMTYDGPLNTSDWQLRTFVFPTESDDNPDFGIRLRAVMNSPANQMYFDDFRLSGTPIPEPTTLGLLCFGMLGLWRRH